MKVVPFIEMSSQRGNVAGWFVHICRMMHSLNNMNVCTHHHGFMNLEINAHMHTRMITAEVGHTSSVWSLKAASWTRKSAINQIVSPRILGDYLCIYCLTMYIRKLSLLFNNTFLLIIVSLLSLLLFMHYKFSSIKKK